LRNAITLQLSLEQNSGKIEATDTPTNTVMPKYFTHPIIPSNLFAVRSDHPYHIDNPRLRHIVHLQNVHRLLLSDSSQRRAAMLTHLVPQYLPIMLLREAPPTSDLPCMACGV
jgi:hypothetical protein